jgi:hypothetical protein
MTTKIIPMIRTIPWPPRMLFRGEPLKRARVQARPNARGSPDSKLSRTRSCWPHSERPKGLPQCERYSGLGFGAGLAVGATMAALPAAAYALSAAGAPYWYSNGVYYAAQGGSYVVTPPPIGAVVPATPPACYTVDLAAGRTYDCGGAVAKGYEIPAADWRGRAQPAQWLNAGDGAWRLLFHLWQCLVSTELQCRWRFVNGRREAGLTFTPAEHDRTAVLRAPHTRVMPRLPASPSSPSGAPGAVGSAGHRRRVLGTHNPRDG